MKQKIVVISFFLITLLSIAVRLYKISAPVADWHSWRQADTAAVAKNFITFGIDPLHPRYFDLSDIQSKKENPEGYRMVELPLYQIVGVGIKNIVPNSSIEVILRVLTVIASTITGLILGLIVYKYISSTAGIATYLVYALLPYSIYYGRTILPDPHAVCWAMVSLYTLDIGMGKQKKSWMYVVCAGIFGAIALLTKPFAAFLLLPAIGIVGWKKPRIQSIKQLVCYGTITILPLILWRMWILQFPEGIPGQSWLLNANNIRFKGAWFYWIFAERIPKLILGYWGMILFGFGLVAALEKDKKSLFLLLLTGSLLYLVIVASGNVQHDYYQIMILPTIVSIVGVGIDSLLQIKQKNYISLGIVGISCLFMGMFSWYTIRTYYWINRPEIIEAGRVADSLIPKNAKVIAPYNGDTTFLYQINRQGWPLGFDIDTKIQMGAAYYITVSPTDNDLETKALANKYTVLVRNERYAIIDLTKKQ